MYGFIVVDSGWFLKELSCFLKQLAQLAQPVLEGSAHVASRGLDFAFNAAFPVLRLVVV